MSSKNIFEELKVLTASLPIESLVKDTIPTSNHSFAACSVFSSNPSGRSNIDKSSRDEIKIKEFTPIITNSEWIVPSSEQELNPVVKTISEETYKSWREIIFQSPISSDQFEFARQSRDYSYLIAIQSVLGVKSGQVIRFLNWMFDSNMYTNKINSSIETKYRDPIGKYPRIQYCFDDNLTVNQKIDRLEKELKKEIPPNMTFEKVDDIKRFMHHFEYRYIHKLKEKVFGIYMGVFWLVCPFSNRSNCPFQLKFTRYTVNHLIVLNKACFRHNHDPWEELPRGKPSNAVEPDVANRIKQKLPIFKICLNKNPVLNKKHIEEISDDDVVIVDSQENLKETNKLDLNFDCNGKTNHNIIDIDISFSSNEHPFEVTTHPRKQLDTNINELKTQTRKK